MKRTLLFFAFAFMLTLSGNAQGFDSLWGKVKDKISGSNNESESKTGDVLSGILGAVTGGKKLTYDKLYGTWNYEGVSCSLESETTRLIPNSLGYSISSQLRRGMARSL